MAAATIDTVVMPGTAQYRVVLDFLKAAVVLYQTALAAHQDAGTGDKSSLAAELLSLRVTDVGDVLHETLAATDPIHPNASVTIANACNKISQDLLLRLEQYSQVEPFHDDSNADQAQFHPLWSLDHVQTLGVRLAQLCHRCHDDYQFARIPDFLHSALGFSYKAVEAAAWSQPSRLEVQQNQYDSGSGDHEQQPVRNATNQELINTMVRQQASSSGQTKPARKAPAGLLNDFILESLAYKSMYDREEEVVQAHAKTFDWVFAESHSSKEHALGRPLKTWLRTSDLGPIYWITGKPGSGKSTFIQYLFQHPSTLSQLHEWASGKPVCKAGFFFWTSGSREQRSQTGLLRSLLHQLLSENMELIPRAFPELWERLQTMTTKDRIKLAMDWSVNELMTAFQCFIDAALPDMRLCLFVDGLDEFEGDHGAIIDFFKNLSLGDQGKSIKMCLSSRPWAVFEDAFQHAVPNLKLQDLTYDDMYCYARDRLHDDARIRQLFNRQAEAEDCVLARATEKADGVFLWIRLAINELLNITTTGRLEMTNLIHLLDSLPGDLDELFSKLLFDQQSAEDLAETAIFFRLIMARELVADFIRDDSASSLTVWELAFATEDNDDNLALESGIQEASEDTIHDRCSKTVYAVKKRFAGLLDLHARQNRGNMRVPRFADSKSRDEGGFNDPEKRVTYIHRTVRDWLMDAEGIQNRLAEKAPIGFDPNIRLLRSYILRMKNPLEEIEHHRRLDEWWSDIALAMTHARYIAVDPHCLQVKFLNELDRTLSWHWLHKPADPYDHWARNAFGSFEARMRTAPIWQPFLCLATKFGLVKYVTEEVTTRTKEDESAISDERRAIERSDSRPLLSYATEFLCSRQKTIFPLSDPKLIAVLLQTPGRINPGPNHEHKDFNPRDIRTPWISLLRHLRDARRRGWIALFDVDSSGTARWTEIVRLFVDVGYADVDAIVETDRWDPQITAPELMELLHETYGAAEIEKLKGLVEGKTEAVAIEGAV